MIIMVINITMIIIFQIDSVNLDPFLQEEIRLLFIRNSLILQQNIEPKKNISIGGI